MAYLPAGKAELEYLKAVAELRVLIGHGADAIRACFGSRAALSCSASRSWR
jgi:hypothetical protein